MSRVGSNRRGVNGIRVEFLPGFTTLQILAELQKMTNEMQCEHEQVTERIIFMSMYNDIVCREKGNIELCNASSRTVAGHAKRFGQGHWSFLDEEQKKKWCGSNTFKPNGQRDDVAEHTLLNFSEKRASRVPVNQCFGTKSFEKQRRRKIVYALLW